MNPAEIRSPFAAEIARSLALDPATPSTPAAPDGVWAGLGAAVRDFVPAAIGETARFVHRAVMANADEVMRRQQQEVDDFTAEAILRRRVELESDRQRRDMALRDFVQRFTPDPATTGVGSQIVFGIGKTLTKAVPSMMLAGPVGGAAIVGALEGGAETQRLEDQGVDPTTAGRAGLATGLVTAVGFGLPAFGATLARTAGLVVAGGPGGFMAQQAATRYILDNADYSDIAQQYDPFDPVGLTVSTLGAAAFGAAGMAAARRGARALSADADAEPAARTVALSERAAATGLHAPDDLDGAAKHVEAIATAGRQIEQGRPVDVESAVHVDAARLAELQIPRAAELPDAMRKIESDLAAKLARDFEAARREYEALADKETAHTHGGKILNTDMARELSAAYRADRSLSAAVHEPASWFVKQLYAQKLAETPEGSIVAFTAGGTGAGKTTAIDSVPAVKAVVDEAAIVYDTNMNTFGSAKDKIDQALAAGKRVYIAYVHRDPVEALVRGALPRAMRMGRTVPLEEHLKTHEGAPRTVLALAEHYRNDPRVTFRVVDNTRGKGKAVVSDLSLLEGLEYTGLREKLRQALEAERAAKRISAAVYRGTLHSEDGRGIPGLGGPRDQGAGPGPELVGRVVRQEAVAGDTATVVTERGLPAPVRSAQEAPEQAVAPSVGVRDVAGAMREQEQSIELQTARRIVAERPDLQLAVAEGERAPAARVLEQAAADAAADRLEAAAYRAAVACFLRG